MLDNLFKRSKKNLLALDIGSQNTKIIKLSPKGIVENFMMAPTPKESFDSGIILDEDRLSEFLLNCFGRLDIKDDIEIVTGVSGKGIITKKIDIPAMEEKLIAEHLPFEAEQYLPYEIDEMELDYEILRNIHTSTGNDIPLLLVAILKNTIQQYDNIFEKSFVTCKILDLNTFALFNTFERNYQLDEEENYLLIDIGLNTTTLVAVTKNQVVFTRSLPVGGDFYTSEIGKELNISHDDAEEQKRIASKESERPEDISSLIKENINPLFCDELFFGYEFYLGFFPNNKASQIYITGGGSQVLDILESLNNKFQVPTHQLNTLQKLQLSPELKGMEQQFIPFASIASGLALRTI